MNKRENERLEKYKYDQVSQLEEKCDKGIITRNNFDLLAKLIGNADDFLEIDEIVALGTTYRATGIYFDKRLEKLGDKLKYLKKSGKSFPAQEGHITHKLIIGDNYDALLNLHIQYRNSIDIVYIDPPYGKDSMGQFAKMNYGNDICRDDLLSMLYPRILLAKDLLKDEGVFFCSIDDRNQAYIKCMLDDIFGEENFYGSLIQSKCNTKNDAKAIQKNHEYILCYVKNFAQRLVLSYENQTKKDILDGGYVLGRDTSASSGHDKLCERDNLGWTLYLRESKEASEFENLKAHADKFSEKYGNFVSFIENGKFIHALAIHDYDKAKAKANPDAKEQDIYTDIKELVDAGYRIIRPPKRKGGKLGCWTWDADFFQKYWNRNEIEITHAKSGKTKIQRRIPVAAEDIVKVEGKSFVLKSTILPLQSLILDKPNSAGTTILSGDKIGIMPGCPFDNPKSIEMLKFLFRSYGNKDAIVLDFFAGSGSTGHAVMDLNREDGGERQFILCTNNLEEDGSIADTITLPRLERIMSGTDDGKKVDFPWLKKNEPYGDGLEVSEIREVDDRQQRKGETAFDVIDETLYGLPTFADCLGKIDWVCGNFSGCRKYLEEANA